jgi:hypothetical protein
MTAYLQMGNDTENLVGEAGLDKFQGIVLSPVNRNDFELKGDVLRYHIQNKYDVVLDPQLYFPRSERGRLSSQPYFDADMDTADLSSEGWWSERVVALATFAKELGVDAVASPVVQPNTWQDDYFVQCAETSQKLSSELSNTSTRVLTTVMVNFNQMAEGDAALKIASIISESEPSGYYLVIVSEVEPRKEFFADAQLAGIMTLIGELEATKRPVVVSHCSSDMLLFKAAGATHCATGKFFNLRRYTRSRYDEPSKGGRPLPYWFEHNLLGFLRQEDVARLIRRGYNNLIGGLASTNFWSQSLLDKFNSPDTEKLLKYSWLQYLCWFGETEFAMSHGDARALVSEWLRTAENNWLMLEDNNILMTEPKNDGKLWLRPWRQALSEFSSNS